MISNSCSLAPMFLTWNVTLPAAVVMADGSKRKSAAWTLMTFPVPPAAPDDVEDDEQAAVAITRAIKDEMNRTRRSIGQPRDERVGRRGRPLIAGQLGVEARRDR
jgi:hypothetical protein